MAKLSAAKSTLLIGLIVAAAIWLLGDTTSAIVIMIVEAVAWAALYAFTSNQTK